MFVSITLLFNTDKYALTNYPLCEDEFMEITVKMNNMERLKAHSGRGTEEMFCILVHLLQETGS